MTPEEAHDKCLAIPMMIGICTVLMDFVLLLTHYFATLKGNGEEHFWELFIAGNLGMFFLGGFFYYIYYITFTKFK